jgi:phage terminase large subunit-like protein
MHSYAGRDPLKAGPKRQVLVPPLDLSHLPKSGERRVSAFASEFLCIPQGKGARKPVRLRPWQKEIVRGLVPGKGQRPRQGVVSMPRGNGKSGLAAVLAAYFLFADGVEGAEVLCVATDERQARIVFNRVRRMVELNPRLEEQVQVFQDRIYVPSTDSSLFPLPSAIDALQGYSPTFAIVDELHYVKEDVWEAMTLASGKREHSLVLGISTPGDNRDSVLHRLCEYGRNNTSDRAFYFKEYAAPVDADIHDEDAWKIANPALDDFLSRDAIRLDVKTAREDNFKRYRMGLWVNGASAWLPRDEWSKCADSSVTVDSRTPVVLAFDGSISDDCTALTGCTVPSDGSRPHLFVVQVWQKDEPGWTVDRNEVDAAVKDAFRRFNVVELVADPYGWRAEIQGWAKRYGSDRVLEFPSYVLSRMAPFTDSLTTAVKQGTVTHDGNASLAAHVANARAKATVYGDVIVKDRKGSPRKIDSAVTSVMAFGRASWHAANPKKKRRLVSVQ